MSGQTAQWASKLGSNVMENHENLTMARHLLTLYTHYMNRINAIQADESDVYMLWNRVYTMVLYYLQLHERGNDYTEAKNVHHANMMALDPYTGVYDPYMDHAATTTPSRDPWVFDGTMKTYRTPSDNPGSGYNEQTASRNHDVDSHDTRTKQRHVQFADEIVAEREQTPSAVEEEREKEPQMALLEGFIRLAETKVSSGGQDIAETYCIGNISHAHEAVGKAERKMQHPDGPETDTVGPTGSPPRHSQDSPREDTGKPVKILGFNQCGKGSVHSGVSSEARTFVETLSTQQSCRPHNPHLPSTNKQRFATNSSLDVHPEVTELESSNDKGISRLFSKICSGPKVPSVEEDSHTSDAGSPVSEGDSNGDDDQDDLLTQMSFVSSDRTGFVEAENERPRNPMSVILESSKREDCSQSAGFNVMDLERESLITPSEDTIAVQPSICGAQSQNSMSDDQVSLSGISPLKPDANDSPAYLNVSQNAEDPLTGCGGTPGRASAGPSGTPPSKRRVPFSEMATASKKLFCDDITSTNQKQASKGSSQNCLPSPYRSHLSLSEKEKIKINLLKSPPVPGRKGKAGRKFTEAYLSGEYQVTTGTESPSRTPTKGSTYKPPLASPPSRSRLPHTPQGKKVDEVRQQVKHSQGSQSKFAAHPKQIVLTERDSNAGKDPVSANKSQSTRKKSLSNYQGLRTSLEMSL